MNANTVFFLLCDVNVRWRLNARGVAKLNLKTVFFLFCDVNFRWRENARGVAKMNLQTVPQTVFALRGSYLCSK